MRRRQFVSGFAMATLWPVAVRAQRGDRARHIGILVGVAESDLEARPILMAFLQELRRLGWTDDRNARFDIRYGESDPGRIRKYAAELVALAPDVILALGPSSVAALLDATAQFRLCLRLCPIRSAPALLIVSQNQAATRPAS